jgi:hypothetical protein
MKTFIKALDQIALYLIPAGYLLLVGYMQNESSLPIIISFIIYSVVIIIYCWKYVRLTHLKMEWEDMRDYYVSNAVNIPLYDRVNLPKMNIEFTLSNLLFRTSNVSQYVEDKVLLFDIEEFDLDRHII